MPALPLDSGPTGGLSSQAEYEAAAEISRRFLRTAAIDHVKTLLSLGDLDDAMIARAEVVLRAARLVMANPTTPSKKIPSIRKSDGSTISLVARLIEILGVTRILEADIDNDPKSRSKSNLRYRASRELIQKVARTIMGEGELLT